uniref:Uncharacterized protein n=1 Tax=Nothobranchius furzeri TaxID=105023 RepID=A0A1A8AVU9_NOTFU
MGHMTQCHHFYLFLSIRLSQVILKACSGADLQNSGCHLVHMEWGEVVRVSETLNSGFLSLCEMLASRPAVRCWSLSPPRVGEDEELLDQPGPQNLVWPKPTGEEISSTQDTM